jgi:hypothetical protein
MLESNKPHLFNYLGYRCGRVLALSIGLSSEVLQLAIRIFNHLHLYLNS